MKKVFLMAIGVFLSTFAFSQNLITVQHLGTASFYNNYNDAFTNALDGDTLYFPGGIYSIGTLNISKRLHVYGVGHYPDSSLATGITQFNGTIKLFTGADSSLFTGIYLNGDFYLGTNALNQEIHNLTIRRCWSSNIYLSYNGSTATPSSDIHIEENVVGRIYGGYATDVYVEQNFLSSNMYYFNGSGINTFRNNIFAYLYGALGGGVSNCNFENNVFLFGASYSVGGTNCVFNNNLFTKNFSFPDGTNTGSNNIFNQTQSTIFVSQSGNAFNYAHDYNLNPASPGNNAGSDGTDVGLYGTTFPYKEGAVPAHPHIREQTISTTTDGAGNINVSIKVGGQNN